MSASTQSPPTNPAVPTVPHLTADDFRAEVQLYEILDQEVQTLGRHGATPERRDAAGRVQRKLTLLKDQITPFIGG